MLVAHQFAQYFDELDRNLRCDSESELTVFQDGCSGVRDDTSLWLAQNPQWALYLPLCPEVNYRLQCPHPLPHHCLERRVSLQHLPNELYLLQFLFLHAIHHKIRQIHDCRTLQRILINRRLKILWNLLIKRLINLLF